MARSGGLDKQLHGVDGNPFLGENRKPFSRSSTGSMSIDMLHLGHSLTLELNIRLFIILSLAGS